MFQRWRGLKLIFTAGLPIPFVSSLRATPYFRETPWAFKY